jgi:putative methionine-R-sulfoxide reductase with GAF domain
MRAFFRQPPLDRNYAAIVARTRFQPGIDREAMMRIAVDALWESLSARGVSWIGFYLKTPDRDEMILGPRRDKPACSPIALHGMCGRCWKDRRPVLVHDVRALGDGYIACDPKDLSEAVVPCFEADGSCWGVLDADSYDVGAFDESDIAGLTRVIEHLGLSTRLTAPSSVLRL